MTPWQMAMLDDSTVAGNGALTYRGALAVSENVFEVGSGSIELTLPAEAQFQLTAIVGSGEIRSDFSFDVGGKVTSNIVEAVVGGNPVVKITATAGIGDIRLKRGN